MTEITESEDASSGSQRKGGYGSQAMLYELINLEEILIMQRISIMRLIDQVRMIQKMNKGLDASDER